jgi:MraZ protein
MTRGQEHCIAVYPLAEFRQKLEEARRAPTTDQRTRDYLRVLLSGAEDVIPDKQGRITIPGHLRSYAGLDRECAVIGALDRLEVWSLPDWENYLEQKEEGFAQTADAVVPGLF